MQQGVVSNGNIIVGLVLLTVLILCNVCSLKPHSAFVWEDPFGHCSSRMITSETTVDKIVPLAPEEAWAAAVTAAGRNGIVSELMERERTVAFFDEDFYCQVIKLAPVGERTRVIIMGARMKGFRLPQEPRDLTHRPARILEALLQERLGEKKWLDILRSPVPSRLP